MPESGSRRSLFIMSAMALLLFGAPLAHPAPLLTINTPGEPPYHYEDQTGIIDRWVKEVFARVGFEVRMIYDPPERGLVSADSGMIDGDAGRIGGLQTQYPNLVQVPEVFMVSSFMAFVRTSTFTPDGWESLRPFRVGCVRGHKIAEANISGTRSLVATRSAESLFEMLRGDRIEVAVCEEVFGSLAARRVDPTIHALSPALDTKDFFLYVHRRHADLVARLSAALAGMKRDGTHERIRREGMASAAARP